MYTLRKVPGKDPVPKNIFLGSTYWVVRREGNPERFEAIVKEFPHVMEDKDIYGVVISSEYKYHFLYGHEENYIMMGNGQTFENLTNKQAYNSQFD